MLLSLQRSAGNRAVAALARSGQPTILAVQRRQFGAGQGYHDAKPGGHDIGPTVIGTIHRIPVDRLKHGYAGKGADPRTVEHADHRAIVLVPDGIDLDRPIDLMVHFHGLSSALTTAGWRETKDGKVADEAVDHIEGQMEAIGNGQLVAILPEGVDKNFGDALSGEAIDEVLRRVFPAYAPGGGGASKPPSYQLILSAHSGGGDYQVGMQAVKAENDRAAGLKPSASNPAAGLQEAHAVILFEGMYPGTEEQVWIWIKRHLDETSKVLTDHSSTPAMRAAALERCPIFRGYISDHPVPTYKKTYSALKSSIEGWFAQHGPTLRPDDAKALGDHFVVSVVPDTNHLNLVRGGDRDAAAGPLADALRAVHHPETHAFPGLGGVPAKKTPAGAGHTRTERTPKPAAAGKAKTATKHASAGAAPQVGPVDDNPILSSALGEVAPRIRYKGVLQEVDLTAFRRAVYDAERAIYLSLGMHPVPNLAKGEVDEVLGIPVRKLIKADLVDLLDTARKARDVAAAAGDQLAQGCTHIGIGSGYRTKEEDFGAWKTTFLKSLGRTQKAREALWHAKSPRDPLGPEAVAMMAENMHAFKATPGFSNHSRGLAVDFTTTQDGVELSASVAQNDLWDASWFHQWLAADEDANAHRFRFHRLKSERWHWDHEAGVPADPAAPDHSAGGGGGPAVKSPVTVPPPKPSGATGASGPPTTAAAQQAPKDQSHVAGVPAGGSAAGTSKQPVGAPTISWGAHAKRDVVAPATLEVLSDVLRAAGLHRATITSTMRTPAEQARVMYANLVAHGVKSQRRLYGAGGRAVIEVFKTQTAAGAAKADVIAAMLAKINELGPYKVSHHCGDPSVLNVLDVGPASLGDDDAIARFEAAARADRRIVRLFTPNQGDPGEHLEIPTGGGGSPPGGSGSVHAPQP
jgi:D-alanyl-D-alanine carboxypeptidase